MYKRQGTIIVVACGILALLLTPAADDGVAKWTLWVYAALALAPASEIALLLVNRLVSDHVTPRHLPRLKLPDGLDATMRTFVVVPTMLVSEQSIAGHARMLETHYLSNGVNTGEIYFALLTDWLDAPVEHADDDARQLQAAADAIHALNARYSDASGGPPLFYLFHRGRQWNPAQGTWMGWERKRGKLHEFNRLLRGRLSGCSSVPTSSVATPNGMIVSASSVMTNRTAGGGGAWCGTFVMNDVSVAPRSSRLNSCSLPRLRSHPIHVPCAGFHCRPRWNR